MKKILFALMFLSAVGGGILIWLLQAKPSDVNPEVATAPAEEHGLHVVDEHPHGGGAEEHAASTEGQHADAPEKHAESAHAAPSSEESEEADAAEAGHGQEPQHASEPSPSPERLTLDHEMPEADLPTHAQTLKKPPSLVIRTEPPGAHIQVNGKERGESPLEIPLLPQGQKIEILAEGYQKYSRMAPAEKEAEGGQINWKIQLKEKPAEVSDHADHEDHAESSPSHTESHAEVPTTLPQEKMPADAFRVGSVGPYLIQLKSVERVKGWDSSVKKLVVKFRDDLAAVSQGEKIFGCPVEVKEAHWVRLLVGPFPSKAVAQERLGEFKKFLPDAYLTGTQHCRK